MKPAIQIKNAAAEDIERICVIENESFVHPWTTACFTDELKSEKSCFLACESKGILIAYSVSWKVYDEIHLNRIAVHRDFRRSGAGRLLVKKTIELCGAGCHRMMLDVRENNTAAIAFYMSLGFTVTGMRKNYYGNENAILMDMELN